MAAMEMSFSVTTTTVFGNGETEAPELAPPIPCAPKDDDSDPDDWSDVSDESIDPNFIARESAGSFLQPAFFTMPSFARAKTMAAGSMKTVKSANSGSSAWNISGPFKNILGKKGAKSEGILTVKFGDEEYNRQHATSHSNHTSTTKYTLLTFLPKNLFEQFHRVANVYFLIISCLQMFTDLTPTGRFTTIGPLSILMAVTGIKDIYEDWQRYKSDKEVNRRKCFALKSGEWVSTAWQDLKVGDVVKIMNNEFFPADMLLLSSDKSNGTCFVETANIDGETNLKMKQAHRETWDLNNPATISRFRGEVLSRPANNIVSGNESFTGTLELPECKGGEFVRHELTHQQFLLRGSQLRNTAEAYALVLFVGKQTKIVLNSRTTPHKMSSLESRINMCLLMSFGCLCLMCIIGATANSIAASSFVDDAWFLSVPASDNWIGLWTTYLLLLNNLIPLSLYVTMEMCKIVQAHFIGWDLDMYHRPTKTFAMARTSGLNEELGQIDYVFSDKTGTLTQNTMVFKKCSIGGAAYSNAGGIERSLDKLRNTLYKVCTTGTPRLESEKAGTPRTGEEGRDSLVYDFVMSCCVNNSAVPEHHETEGLIYQASPDERALVDFAASVGFRLVHRTDRSITVANEHTQEEMEIAILHVIDFTSDRKRMSVICELPSGRRVMYCKGADDVMYSRLSRESSAALGAVTTRHLDQFASSGLRTLVVACREINDVEYKTWSKLYHDASVSMDGDRQTNIESVVSMMEQKLELIGATAIEDKLQSGVATTIANLQYSGIKVWVMTGDKEETATNIGLSCKLIRSAEALLKVEGAKVGGTLKANRSAVFDSLRLALHKFRDMDPANRRNVTLLIGGESLRIVLDSTTMRPTFLRLARRVVSVVCCRVSPMQKAQMVKLVRDNTNYITLAIGDGANDVPMILSAHVGVGISGNEGMQAVRASDYSIAQFRFLRPLLMVHGHWAYVRICHVALYSFYKSSVLFMTQFWFAMFNLWSGQTLFERWTQAAYNLFFSSLPIFGYGCFDRDVEARTLKKMPTLYLPGRNNAYFGTRVYALWLLRGLFHSLVAFLFPAGVFNIDWGQSGIVSVDGQERGLYVMGLYTYTIIVLVVTLRLLMLQRCQTWVSFWFCTGSVLLWFLYNIVYSRMDWNAGVAYYLMDKTWDHAQFWLSLPVAVIISLLPDGLATMHKRLFRPSVRDVAVEIQKANMFATVKKQHSKVSA